MNPFTGGFDESSPGLLDMTVLGRQEDWEEPKGRIAPVRGRDPTFTS